MPNILLITTRIGLPLLSEIPRNNILNEFIGIKRLSIHYFENNTYLCMTI